MTRAGWRGPISALGHQERRPRRFHALERDGSLRRAPGHISWNVWLDGAWRQMAIIQGEGLELSEVPRERWNGLTHPGRLRFQTFRPGHGEPLTDALIGQGMMSLGGGGYGGGGLPYPSEVLQLWGGAIAAGDDPHPGGADRGQGRRLGRAPTMRSSPSARRAVARPPPPPAGPGAWRRSAGTACPGADAYIVVRDGKERAGPLRMEGSRKEWTDRSGPSRRASRTFATLKNRPELLRIGGSTMTRAGQGEPCQEDAPPAREKPVCACRPRTFRVDSSFVKPSGAG